MQIDGELYHLCVLRRSYITCALCWVTVRYTIFLGGRLLCATTLLADRWGRSSPCSNRGLYNARFISRSFFAPSYTVSIPLTYRINTIMQNKYWLTHKPMLIHMYTQKSLISWSKKHLTKWNRRAYMQAVFYCITIDLYARLCYITAVLFNCVKKP